MSRAAKRFMTMSIWISIGLFIIRCLMDFSGITSLINHHEYLTCSYSIYGYAGESIVLATIFMTLFNKWLWKKKPFYFFAEGLPVLAKHYRGTITFIWDDKEQTRSSEIWINQTFLNVSVKFGTNESISNSITASIEINNNEHQLIYTYLNTPRAELQNRSAIHYGTAMISIDNPKELIGNYYTSRTTRGSMIFQAAE